MRTENTKYRQLLYVDNFDTPLNSQLQAPQNIYLNFRAWLEVRNRSSHMLVQQHNNQMLSGQRL